MNFKHFIISTLIVTSFTATAETSQNTLNYASRLFESELNSPLLTPRGDIKAYKLDGDTIYYSAYMRKQFDEEPTQEGANDVFCRLHREQKSMGVKGHYTLIDQNLKEYEITVSASDCKNIDVNPDQFGEIKHSKLGISLEKFRDSEYRDLFECSAFSQAKKSAYTRWHNWIAETGEFQNADKLLDYKFRAPESYTKAFYNDEHYKKQMRRVCRSLKNELTK